MKPEEIEHMAQDFASWVRQTVAGLRAGIVFDEAGMPDFDPATTRGLQETVAELSPDAARYALVAALIALVQAEENEKPPQQR